MTRRLVIITLLLLTGLLILPGCKSGVDEEATTNGNGSEKIFKVSVSSPEIMNIDQEISATGTAHADLDVSVKTQVTGVIDKVMVDEGSFVKEGDILIQIELEKFKLYLEQAKAALAQASAAYENARLELDRKQKLFEKNAISQGMFDAVKAQYESMKAAKEAANVQVELAERSYNDAQLKSPLTGYVKARMIDPGEYVDTMTSGPIFEIIKIDPIKVQFNLPEKYASMVEPGYKFSSSFTSLPGEKYDGVISIVSPAVDQQTRTVMLEGKISNPKSRIKAGSFAEVVLTLKGSNKALVVPTKAIVSEQGQKYIFKVDGDSVVKTRIKIGSVVDGVEEVIEGITSNDKIVVDGLNGLFTGAKIEIE